MDFKLLVKHCITCKDNETADVGKVAFLGALASYLIMVSCNMWLNKQFDALGVGGGIAAIFGGTGICLSFKKDTEPQ